MTPQPAMNPAAAKPSSARWKWAGWLLALAVLGALAVHFQLFTHLRHALQAVLEWIRPMGVWAPVVFVLFYIIACVALVPATVLTVGAGALFGVVQGSICVSIGATLGATASFLIGRHFARDWVTKRIAGHPVFAAIERAVAEGGGKIVLLTRLCPVFPFFMMNYGYGLTRVALSRYFFATWIGILPGSTLLVYVGSLANPGEAKDTPAMWAMKIVGLLATIAMMIYIGKVAKRALSNTLPVPVENTDDPA